MYDFRNYNILLMFALFSEFITYIFASYVMSDIYTTLHEFLLMV
jgi:hypothetical protein